MLVLYALNGIYVMNEKGALARAGSLARKPEGIKERIEGIYRLIAGGGIREAFDGLERLQREIEALTRET
jgi:hypothetical protein